MDEARGHSGEHRQHAARPRLDTHRGSMAPRFRGRCFPIMSGENSGSLDTSGQVSCRVAGQGSMEAAVSGGSNTGAANVSAAVLGLTRSGDPKRRQMRPSCSSLVPPGSSGRPLTISAKMQPTPLGRERKGRRVNVRSFHGGRSFPVALQQAYHMSMSPE